MRMRSLLLLLGILLIPVRLPAQDTIPAPACIQPPVPDAVTSRDAAEAVEAEIREYMACMSAYIDEQRSTAAAHTDAANKAIADLNAFIERANSAKIEIRQ